MISVKVRDNVSGAPFCTNGQLHPGMPLEALERILVESVRPPDDDPFATVSWADHVNVTAVCALWRTVLLRCPRFWTHIPIDDCERTLEMLARSKGVPRSVRMLGPADDDPNPDQLVPLVQIPDWYLFNTMMAPKCLGEFHLCTGSYDFWDPRIHAFPQDEAPVLTSLIIRWRESADARNVLQDLQSLPRYVLGALRPCLRYLHLEGCMVPWDTLEEDISTFPLNNLLTLELVDVTPPPKPLLSKILSLSLHLEVLSLIGCIPPDFSIAQTGYKFPLLFLRSICLAGTGQDCCSFEESIERPTSAKADYELEEPSAQDDRVTDECLVKCALEPLLSACGFCPVDGSSTSSGSRTFRSMAIHLSSSDHELRVYEDLRPLESDGYSAGTGPPWSPESGTGCHIVPSIRIRTHRSLFSVIPQLPSQLLEGVQQLHLGVVQREIGGERREDCVSFLKPFSNVHTLSLKPLARFYATWANDITFLSSLTEPPPASPAIPPPPTDASTKPPQQLGVLPSLRTITLSNFDFECPLTTGSPLLLRGGPCPLHCPISDSFLHLIQNRAQRASIPLTKLCFVSCRGSLDQTHLDYLSEEAKETTVSWENMPGGSSTSRHGPSTTRFHYQVVPPSPPATTSLPLPPTSLPPSPLDLPFLSLVSSP